MNAVVEKAHWLMKSREMITLEVSVDLFEMYEDVFVSWENRLQKKYPPLKASQIMIRAFKIYLNDEG